MKSAPKAFSNKNNTINTSNGGTCIPYSLHHVPPFQKVGFNSSNYNKNNITANYNQRHFLHPKKPHQLAPPGSTSVKLPVSIPSSPRHLNRNVKKSPSNHSGSNSIVESESESYMMSPKRMHRILSIKTEIDFNEFIDTIDKNDYLRYDFPFLEDVCLHRIAPNPNYGISEINEKYSQTSMSPAETILLDLKGNSESLPKFQTDGQRYSYLTHLISDSITGIRNSHKGSLRDDKIHTIDDVFYAQRELDVFFASMNESVKLIVQKCKPLALILHNIQKGFLGNSRRLLESIVELIKENEKLSSKRKPKNNQDNLSLNPSDEIQQVFNPKQNDITNADSNDSNLNCMESENSNSSNFNDTEGSNLHSTEKLLSTIAALKKEVNVEKGRNADLNILLLSLKMQVAESKRQNQQLANMNSELNNTIGELKEKLIQKDDDKKSSRKSKKVKNNLKMQFDDYFGNINNRLNKTYHNEYGDIFDFKNKQDEDDIQNQFDEDNQNSQIQNLENQSQNEAENLEEDINEGENHETINNDNEQENNEDIQNEENTELETKEEVKNETNENGQNEGENVNQEEIQNDDLVETQNENHDEAQKEDTEENQNENPDDIQNENHEIAQNDNPEENQNDNPEKNSNNNIDENQNENPDEIQNENHEEVQNEDENENQAEN